jgi:hypothetical protein
MSSNRQVVISGVLGGAFGMALVQGAFYDPRWLYLVPILAVLLVVNVMWGHR